MIECWKRGLYLQGLFHDWDKFLVPSMWISYAKYFYGEENTIDKSEGYIKPNDTGEMDYEMAWLGHLHRNKHHWQWWIRYNDDGGVVTFPMEERHALEMICDWIGAGKAQGFHSPKENPLYETRTWYLKNREKIKLHEETRKYVEDYLGIS